MWYTFLIAIDALALWWVSSALLSLIEWGGFPIRAILAYASAWIHLHLGVPHGVLELLEHGSIPLIILCGYYTLPLLPRCDAVRHSSVWDWMRVHHTPVRWWRIRSGNAVEPVELRELPHALRTLDEPPVMYACAPHSVFAEHLHLAMVLNAAFSEVRVVCTSLLFWIPLMRECVGLCGCVPATMHAIMEQLDGGRDVAIVPEGLRGLLHPGRSVQVLRGVPGESGPRHGFVRAALTAQHGCTLVPVYTHGTKRMYDVWLPWPWFQKRMLRAFMYPWPVIHFGWFGTFWHKAGPLDFVIGDAIDTSAGRSVVEVHADFCSTMDRLQAARIPK